MCKTLIIHQLITAQHYCTWIINYTLYFNCTIPSGGEKKKTDAPQHDLHLCTPSIHIFPSRPDLAVSSTSLPSHAPSNPLDLDFISQFSHHPSFVFLKHSQGNASTPSTTSCPVTIFTPLLHDGLSSHLFSMNRHPSATSLCFSRPVVPLMVLISSLSLSISFFSAPCFFLPSFLLCRVLTWSCVSCGVVCVLQFSQY